MNNVRGKFALLIILTLLFRLTYTDSGCMDRSKHAYYCNDGAAICNNESRYHNDYKRWHKVPCFCPCWKYKPSSRRNRCVYCRHFHDPAVNAEEASVNYYPTIKLRRALRVRRQRPQYYVPKKVQRSQD